ncbi:hypothetical protein BKA63DRAFT_419291 [Paraphoma chrysanthemicola]|nr:hypothetical protein BKA63DRAFT_419291 [Paraphoma chrysanthemicola]
MPIHVPLKKDEVQALRDRVAFFHELVKQYRKVTRAHFVEEIVLGKVNFFKEKIASARNLPKQRGWEASTEAVLERHAKLNDWERDILNNPPSFQQDVAAKQRVDREEERALRKIRLYHKQIFRLCEELNAEGTEAARNSDAAKI